jgi:hypothetical protein
MWVMRVTIAAQYSGDGARWSIEFSELMSLVDHGSHGSHGSRLGLPRRSGLLSPHLPGDIPHALVAHTFCPARCRDRADRPRRPERRTPCPEPRRGASPESRAPSPEPRAPSAERRAPIGGTPAGNQDGDSAIRITDARRCIKGTSERRESGNSRTSGSAWNTGGSDAGNRRPITEHVSGYARRTKQSSQNRGAGCREDRDAQGDPRNAARRGL